MISFLFLTVSSPFKLGVYEDGVLVREYEKDGKASDVLPIIIDESLREYTPNEIFYTNGPGNHISLKIAYVCFRAICIIKKIPLYGVAPFEFNGGDPIRAFANSYFVYEAGKISVKVFEEALEASEFLLPKVFDINEKGGCEPLFILPAV